MKTQAKSARRSRKSAPLPAWHNPLSKHLEETLKIHRDFGRVNCQTRARAVREICNGVAFCHERGIPVAKHTLSRTFDIEDRCNCLLAKATGERFSVAVEKLGITYSIATEIGCLGHIPIEYYSIAKSQDFGKWVSVNWVNWEELYNFLWKKTGRWLMNNPQFGMN